MPYNSQITRSDAEALIPEEVSKEIIQSLPKASAALQLFRRTTMSRKSTRMPVLSALPAAYWVSGDTGLKQTSEQAWGNKYLTAEELAVIVPIPQAVLDDADFDIWGEVKPKLVEAFGVKIDGATIFGTDAPSSWPNSVVEGAVAAGNVLERGSVADQDIAGDVGAEGGIMNLVEEDGFDVSGFAARKRMKAAFRGLRDENGQPIFQPSLTAGTPGSLYGESIFYVENGSWENDSADLIGGDWSNGIVAIRQDITYDIATEAVIQDGDGDIIYNLFQQDMVALRAVMRLAFQVANPINRQNTDADTRYPWAVLQPAGS